MSPPIPKAGGMNEEEGMKVSQTIPSSAATQADPIVSTPLDRVTPAQRRALQYVADNSGRLYGSRRDFPPSIVRRDVLDRLWFGGLIETPRNTDTRTWEITPAGRAALSDGRASDRAPADAEPSMGRRDTNNPEESQG